MGEPTNEEAAQPSEPSVSPKEAVDAAMAHFAEITGITDGVVTEELETTGDGKYWLVTLGFRDKVGPRAYSLTEQKSYKQLKVDASTGRVLSMKVREL
jgi:hypothetical protein